MYSVFARAKAGKGASERERDGASRRRIINAFFRCNKKAAVVTRRNIQPDRYFATGRIRFARSLAGRRAENHAIGGGGGGGGESAALPPTCRCRRALGGGGNCM